MNDNKSEGVIIEGDLEAFIAEIESGEALSKWYELANGKEKVLNRMEEIYRSSWPTPTYPMNRIEEEMAWAPANTRWPTFKDKLREVCMRVGWVPREHRATRGEGI